MRAFLEDEATPSTAQRGALHRCDQKWSRGQQVEPVAGEESDHDAAGEDFFRAREIPESQSRCARNEDDNGVEVKDRDAAVDEEGEGIEEQGSGEVAVEKLEGRASGAAGNAGQSGQGVKGTLRRGETGARTRARGQGTCLTRPGAKPVRDRFPGPRSDDGKAAFAPLKISDGPRDRRRRPPITARTKPPPQQTMIGRRMARRARPVVVWWARARPMHSTTMHQMPEMSPPQNRKIMSG